MKKKAVSIALVLSMLMSFATLARAAGTGSGDGTSLFFYISDQTPVSASVGWGTLRIDADLDGALRLKDASGTVQTYTKGMCAHAPSQLVYNIDGMGATRFTSIIGVNYDGNSSGGTCTFTVTADSTVIFQSGVLNKNGAAGQVDVAIPAGTKTLTLSTGDAGDGGAYDHSVWVEPKLYVPSLSKVLGVQLLATRQLLAAGDSTQLLLHGKTVGGDTINLPIDGSVSFVSDNTGVATVDAAGTVRAVSSGTANITCTANITGTVETATLPVTVSANTWTVNSPSARSSVTFQMNNGALSYCASQDGKPVINASAAGLVTSVNDFSAGLAFSGVSSREINETYTMVSGKKSTCVNHANETTIAFLKGAQEFDVVVRAYDDGFAYRYLVRNTDNTAAPLSVSDEKSAFAVPAGSDIYAMPNPDGATNNEALFQKQKIEAASGDKTMPLLYKTPDGEWALLSEAVLDGTDSGSILRPAGNDVLKVNFPSQQSGAAVSALPFVSPWRFAITGSLGDIVESTMAQNLSPDSAIGDASWVQPGVTSWSWLTEGFNGQGNPDTIKKYIDLSHDMGWKYFIMDAGWQPGDPTGVNHFAGYYSWIDDVIQYANSKGVGLIAWVYADDMNTPAKRAVLKEWADKGIKGIKIDFFDRESQDRIQLYNAIYQTCAQDHLVVVCHGANKPTGEIRTYPNVLGREGIRGEEYNNFLLDQTTTQPFTRAVLGPTDITPRLYPDSGSATTIGQQLAMSIVFECGMPCMAGSPSDYANSPAVSFLRNLPAAWDDTKFIDGTPGDFFTVARRKGDLWYAASMTNAARTAAIPLSFLDADKTYYAVIYHDGAGKNDITVDVQKVTAQSVLNIPMSQGGGCTVKLQQNAPDMPTGISLSQNALTLGQYKTAALTAAITPANAELKDVVWASSDPSVATVDQAGTVTAVAAGMAQITATSKYDASVSASCSVRVTKTPYRLTNVWAVERENKAKYELLGTNSVKITTMVGDLGEHSTTNNVLLTNAPQGDFSVTVKVTPQSAFYHDYQTVALAAYGDDNNLVAAMRRYHTGYGGNVFENYRYQGGYQEQTAADTSPSAPAWLKLTRTGDSFQAFYSLDGTSWVAVGSPVTQSAVTGSGNMKIALYADNGDGVGGLDNTAVVTIENFTVNGTPVPFAEPTQNYILTPAPVSAAVSYGTPFASVGLPAAIQMPLADGTDQTLPVSWSAGGYQASAAGTYTVMGTVALPGDGSLTNPLSVTAQASVTVLPQDNTALQAALAKAAQLSQSDYTADSWAALQSAVQAAQSLGAAASQQQMNDAAAAVNNAILGLVEKNRSYITGITAGMTASQLLQKLTADGILDPGAQAQVTDANGNPVTGGAIIATGMKVSVTGHAYLVAVTGDLNGDGSVTAADLLMLKRFILGLENPQEAFVLAANVNHDAEGSVNSTDLLSLKRFLLGLAPLS